MDLLPCSLSLLLLLVLIQTLVLLGFFSGLLFVTGLGHLPSERRRLRWTFTTSLLPGLVLVVRPFPRLTALKSSLGRWAFPGAAAAHVSFPLLRTSEALTRASGPPVGSSSGCSLLLHLLFLHRPLHPDGPSLQLAAVQFESQLHRVCILTTGQEQG